MPSRLVTEHTRTRSSTVAGPTFDQFVRRQPSFGVSENRPPSAFVRPNYPHTSIFRSSELVLNLFSASIKVPKKAGQDKNITPLPVYGDRDKVMGSVVLDLPSAQQTGHFTVSIAGTFFFHSERLRFPDGVAVPAGAKQTKHVFYSASLNVPLSSAETPSRSMFRIRKSPSRSQLSKMRSLEAINAEPPRAFPFEFEIPQPLETGEEMPPSFSMWNMVQSGDRGRAYSEIAEVSYKVSVTWESGDGSGDRAFVETPILFQPDTDYTSLTSLDSDPDSWLEYALHSDQEAGFDCAITVPNPTAFPRSAAVPYFVVFKTKPQSPSLARAISATTSITINFVREVAIDPIESQALGLSEPPSPSQATPPPSSYGRFTNIPESAPNSPITPRSESSLGHKNVWKRMLKSVAPEPNAVLNLAERLAPQDPHASLWTEDRATSGNRPRRPSVRTPGSQGSYPDTAMREIRILAADSTIGFPKRPRQRSGSSPEGNHRSLDNDLPDGLYKSQIRLTKSMLPTLDWPGVSVNYYFDVSVIFADKHVQGRVPVRIY